MNKIVDTLIVAAMLMASVPSLADAPVLTYTPAHEQAHHQPQEQPEDADDLNDAAQSS